MAKIITKRPEAMAYNGRDGKFVRHVIDGLAFDPNVDQVIVEIDGSELYFYASEVQMSDDEKKSADKKRKEALKAQEEGRERSRKAMAAKRKMLKEASAADGDAAKDARKEAESKEPKPEQADDERLRFNRLPTDPPVRPQTDHPPVDPNPDPIRRAQGETHVERPLPTGAQPGGASVPPDPNSRPEPARIAELQGGVASS